MQFMSRILLFSVVLLGCSGQFSSRFVNFNAYYNTFYNAQLSYGQGYNKSTEQTRKFNFLLPIRVYQTPLGAGMQELQSTIDKGADILRDHKESKWVDNALELIGKSYFFRTEYFSADQKFDELLLTTDDPLLQQKGVFWKARVFMELELYTQGVQYLEEQRTSYDGKWLENMEAQILTMLAELYVARQNYEAAIPLLEQSAASLPGRALKERAFFLLGQLNDFQGYTQNAFNAFDRVSDYYFNYEIQFEAQKKKADVARQLGLVDEAYSVLADMVKDDKNTEYVADLRLELGLTELQRNRPEKAETIFLDLLRDQQFPAEARTKALTYYALADIYRFNNNNFSLAAAYYDSAARINVPSENLPEYYNAQELSASFGEYARLKSNIQLEDSLLYLGSLEPAQFDSVIQIIQQKQQAELERLQQEQEDRANTLVTIDRESNTGPNSASNSGFLNELDQRVSADASQQFNALWMGRSLTDYWRFESLARNIITQDSSAVESSNEENATIQLQKKYTIDISAIPFDLADKDSAYERLSTYYYGIGNLFFLNLNDTDSAEYYFSKVWAEHPQSKVAPVSLYSLAEIASTRDQINRAKELGKIIVQNFPNTVYAKRTAERFSIPMVQDSSAQPSEFDTFRKLYNNFEMGAEVGLDSLFSWGISARNSILGEQAYRIGLTHYIENITMDSLYQQDQARWLTEKERWVTGQANLLAFKDSIEISLEDSLLDPMEEEELAALLDSNLVEPVWYDLFPYTGPNWDIARNNLAVYDSVFMKPVKNPDLMRLKQELTPPENPYAIAVDSSLNDSLEVHGFLADSLQPDSLSMDSFSNDSLTQVSDLANSVEEGSTIDDYQSCADLDSTPSFRGGIQALLSSISYPEGVIISPVSYRFFINERGIIDRFETVDSASNAELSPDLVEAINARLASEVAFEPTIINGRSIRLVCEIVIDPSELE